MIHTMRIMGNSSSNVSKRPHVTALTDTLNVLRLKTGYVLEIPIRMISMNPNISVNEINNECIMNGALVSLGISCVDIDNHRKVAKFMISAYYHERHNIEGLEKNILSSVPNEENEILEYHKNVARRIWTDLNEYIGLLDKLVTQKTKKLKIYGSHTIEIIADYTDIDGRYLYELGDYAIRFPYLKDMILERFINDFKDKRINFKTVVVKYISTDKIEKGIQFLFFIDIMKN